jgi:endonuclease/exonuclease/phosphatase family metal-dependent hydrolase
VTITRGWISVDATVHGQAVRVIARHLESFYEPVQEAQAAELVAGPGATTLPVAIAGDLNTGPGSAQTASYAFPHGSCRVHGHLGRDVRAEQSRVHRLVLHGRPVHGRTRWSERAHRPRPRAWGCRVIGAEGLPRGHRDPASLRPRHVVATVMIPG